MNVQETIDELLNAPEGERYQFKEWKSKGDMREAAKICCALANCGGGKLVLGVSDKRPRKVVGTEAFLNPERTRIYLMDKLRVLVDFYIIQHKDGRVLVFVVAGRPMGLPVQVDGDAWWYHGDSLILLPEDIRRSIYAESGHDFSCDICEGATIDDLDSRAIETFRAKWAKKSGSSIVKNAPVEQLLVDCGATNDNGVTYAAIILFGTPQALNNFLRQAELVFEYRANETSGPAQQRLNIREGFFLYFDRVWETINLRNNLQHYQEGFFIFDIHTFNESVVREALLNAVSHRNYQLAGSIFVRQYDDRLVIDSPGGFPTGITTENILYKQSPRNRLIAEIFALCGLVERAGQGINLIYEYSIKEAKALPDFTGTDAFSVCLTLNGLVLDSNLLLLIEKIEKDNTKSLSTDDFLLINALFHGHKIPENIRSRIKHLTDIGIIETIGRGKYIPARKFYEAIGKQGVHTRLKGLDKGTNMELIKKHIERNGKVGTPLKELYQVLPNHNRGQIQMLLRALQRDNIIRVEGKTSSARWFSM